jgi:geranylgeranyl diphosphate synthase type II
MEYEERNDVQIPEYIEMIRLKTAVLLACALKTGSIIGGAGKEDIDKMYEIGENLGIAFQLQDDILDAFGTAKIGKRKGGDIISNKKTYLLITALKEAQGETLEELNKWISATDFDEEEKVAAVLAIFEKLNIRNISEVEMSKYSDVAFKMMADLDLPIERKKNILSVMNNLLKRDY